MMKALGAGVDVSLAGSAAVLKRWLIDQSYSSQGVPFSAKVNDISRVTEIRKSIVDAVAYQKAWRKAAQDLHDLGIQKADVNKKIKEVELAARKAFAMSNDADGYYEYKQAVKRAQQSVNKLIEPSTSKLRRAYQDVLDLTETVSEKALDNAVKYAAYFKERYNAERIARTEMARAYGDGFFAQNVNNDDAVGWRVELSSAHVVTDICDFHTSADLYGMGPGVYPKDKGPKYPFHPHCTCVLSTVYIGDAVEQTSGFDPGRGAKYLEKLPKKDAVELLGVGGYEQFQENPDRWQSVLKNWQGHETKTARVPLEIIGKV
jgi:hypothetical protein